MMILSYIRSFINIVVYLLIKDKSKINADIERYLESYGITPPRLSENVSWRCTTEGRTAIATPPKPI